MGPSLRAVAAALALLAYATFDNPSSAAVQFESLLSDVRHHCTLEGLSGGDECKLERWELDEEEGPLKLGNLTQCKPTCRRARDCYRKRNDAKTRARGTRLLTGLISPLFETSMKPWEKTCKQLIVSAGKPPGARSSWFLTGVWYSLFLGVAWGIVYWDARQDRVARRNKKNTAQKAKLLRLAIMDAANVTAFSITDKNFTDWARHMRTGVNELGNGLLRQQLKRLKRKIEATFEFSLPNTRFMTQGERLLFRVARALESFLWATQCYSWAIFCSGMVTISLDIVTNLSIDLLHPLRRGRSEGPLFSRLLLIVQNLFLLVISVLFLPVVLESAFSWTTLFWKREIAYFVIKAPWLLKLFGRKDAADAQAFLSRIPRLLNHGAKADDVFAKKYEYHQAVRNDDRISQSEKAAIHTALDYVAEYRSLEILKENHVAIGASGPDKVTFAFVAHEWEAFEKRIAESALGQEDKRKVLQAADYATQHALKSDMKIQLSARFVYTFIAWFGLAPLLFLVVTRVRQWDTAALISVALGWAVLSLSLWLVTLTLRTIVKSQILKTLVVVLGVAFGYITFMAYVSTDRANFGACFLILYVAAAIVTIFYRTKLTKVRLSFTALLLFFSVLLILIQFETITSPLQLTGQAVAEPAASRSLLRKPRTPTAGTPPGAAERYPVCTMRWGKVGVVDCALLSELVYYDPETADFKNRTALWFPGRRLTVKTPKRFNSPKGYFVHFQLDGQDIVAIRGTAQPSDVAEDLELYHEAALLTVASWFLPVSLMPERVRTWWVGTLTKVENVFQSQYTNYHEIIEEYIADVADARKLKISELAQGLVIVGHSLGGGTANIVGAKVNASSVTFSAPGILMSRKKFGLHFNPNVEGSAYFRQSLDRLQCNIIPKSDLVPGIDIHTGMIQNIDCDASQLHCHSIVKTKHTLLKACLNYSLTMNEALKAHPMPPR